MTEPLRFELPRLLSYDRDSLIGELHRVAKIERNGPLTRQLFDKHARVESSTMVRRLGDWRTALTLAGLEARYSGRIVSENMREQRARSLTNEQLLDELSRVARALGRKTLTREQFRTHSRGISDSAVARRFGSWSEALGRAGLSLSRHGRRWTDDDYLENLLSVWTFHGRAPTYAEMNRPPSRITAGAYEAKFGTWGKARAAFVDHVNADLELVARLSSPRAGEQLELAMSSRRGARPEDSRSIPLGLRYKVLLRGRFRCAKCGRSPATDLAVQLHVDHIVPMARGGNTTEENLQVLCADCNLGKGSSDQDEVSGGTLGT